MERGGDDRQEVGLVLSFFRSPVALTRAQRDIFRRQLLPAELAEHLKRAPLNLRDDLARLFVAAEMAARHRAPLLLAEGWRCHTLARSGAGTSRLTGSRLGHLLLRMLQRRGLAPPDLQVVRRSRSRCTLEEVACALETAPAGPGRRIVGVAGRACPSRARAQRYFRLLGATEARVVDCWRVLAEWSPRLTPEQRAFTSALAPSRGERLGETAFEGANWLVHALSRAESRLSRGTVPLEVRLVRRLRRDAPQ